MAQQAKVFSDRYEIVRRIARGGMAEVFLARDLLLDRPVALKILFPELSRDSNFVERFRREAQAAANLTHPNIVSIYDWGEEDGTYFIVMEYVDGKPLSQLIRTEGALPAPQAADIGGAVAAALAFAHRNGVIHRDVKPGNVLLDAAGNVKVTDFGIARATNAAQDNLTQTGTVMGTATYFSPEQAQGFGVDNRSDVYSLGVVLYEMVTGQPPFAGENPVSVAYRHVSEVPQRPTAVNAEVPAAFEAIVLKALAKEPGDRYASAEDLRTDLIRFRRGKAVAARPPSAENTAAMAATSVQPRASATAAMTRVQPAAAPGGGGPRTGTYVALLVFLLGVLGILLFLLAHSLGILNTSTPTRVDVPNVVGLQADEATRQLTAAGLKFDRANEGNDAAAGTVFSQDPPGGQTADKGSAVTIHVSTGPKITEVPSVVGQDVADATAVLTEAGFKVKPVSRQDATQPANRVLSQNPAPGTKAPEGTTVMLTVSAGKAKTTVPNVVGQDENAAFDAISKAKLTPRRTTEASDTVPAGTVIRTSPAAGQQVDEGSTVTVVVSSGSAQPTTTEGPAPTTTTAFGFP